MVSIQILKSTSLAIRTIEDTLAALDPYNHQFPEEENYSIGSCEFSDQIEDPLAIVRLIKGDEFAKRLEYEDHIEHILYSLTTCFNEELARRGCREADLDDEAPTE